MKYIGNWEEIKTHMRGYWDREVMDRCCVALMVNDPGFDFDANGLQNYFNAERADAAHRERFAHQAFFGEAIPCLFPYFSTAGTAEYTGCRAERTPRTVWFYPWMDEEEEPDASRISFSHPEAFLRQEEAIAKMVELSRGDYFVTVSDNCGIVDALAAIRGSENLLMDMYTDPGFVEEGVRRLLPIYKKTQERLFDLLKENNEGSILSWMHLWAPQRLAQMQCDLSVMISKEMYDRFVMPELEELCDFLDYPVYHLDGQEQIRHLDSLLSIKNLRAIQWQNVAGQPGVTTFIPVLQKIQKAGKNLVVSADAQDVVKLLDNLSCRGLQLRIGGVKTVEEANEMMALVTKHSRDHHL